MKREFVVMAAIALILSMGLMAGCTSLARRIESFTNYATKPTNKQDCQAMLILAKTERDGIVGRRDALLDLKAVYPKLENSDTEKTLTEMHANIVWLTEQIEQLEALLPTLPDRDAPSVIEPAPAPGS